MRAVIILFIILGGTVIQQRIVSGKEYINSSRSVMHSVCCSYVVKGHKVVDIIVA